MAKILLVEDDHDLCSIISDSLSLQNHVVETVHNGFEGQEKLFFYKYDLVILDWALPNISGLDLCRQYRDKKGTTPILMLTGKKAIQDKEVGLDAGADDYLTKPFELKELEARVRALLRRPSAYVSNVLRVGDLVVEPAHYKVTKGNIEIQLLPKEFALLEFLLRHQGQIFSTQALLDRVWSSESDASPAALRTCLKRLRQKIDREGKPSIIRNVTGLGYKIEG